MLVFQVQALQYLRRPCEILEPARSLALIERGWDRHRSIQLDAGRPELVSHMDVGEADRSDWIVRPDAVVGSLPTVKQSGPNQGTREDRSTWKIHLPPR